MDLSLPHNKVALGATFIALSSLLISWKMDSCGISFWSSIFANIFAGLITGLVICLIAGRKQRTIAELESQQNFLVELSAKIKEFQSMYHELLRKQFAQFDGDEKLFNFIYDVGSHANWVNDYILQGSFNEQLAIDPTTYCKEMGYDALALVDEYEDLHVKLYSIDVDNPTKKQIIQYFDKVEKALRALGGAIYHQQQSISLKLAQLENWVNSASQKEWSITPIAEFRPLLHSIPFGTVSDDRLMQLIEKILEKDLNMSYLLLEYAIAQERALK